MRPATVILSLAIVLSGGIANDVHAVGSEYFVGKYERASASAAKCDEFLSALGVGWLMRKGFMIYTPTMEVRSTWA